MLTLLLSREEQNYNDKLEQSQRLLKSVEENCEAKMLLSKQVGSEASKVEMLTLLLKKEEQNFVDKLDQSKLLLKTIEDNCEAKMILNKQLCIEAAKAETMTLLLKREETHHIEQTNKDNEKLSVLIMEMDKQRQENRDKEDKLLKERENCRDNNLEFAKLHADVLKAAFNK
jgi:hypothetical protein